MKVISRAALAVNLFKYIGLQFAVSCLALVSLRQHAYGWAIASLPVLILVTLSFSVVLADWRTPGATRARVAARKKKPK